jgi:iron complex outermembrane recepter protein
VAALVAAAMPLGAALAQQAPSAGTSTNAVSLPEIKVIGTTPLAPSRPVARPAAAAATAAPAATPETASKAVPGVVELDKIPSNVQTVGASAFDGTKAPDLLQSMERALPGVSLSSQTGNDFQLDFNYRGYVAGPVIGTPQGLAVYQNGVRSTRSSATSSIGT